MRASRYPAALLAAALLLCAPPAEAKRGRGVLHKVKTKGETYAQIAEHYYGQRFLGHHLRVVNRHPEPLAKGRSLVVPTTRRVPLAQGQSLAAFAKKHLGKASRAAYLETLHFLKSKRPRPGKRLKVPTSLRHVVRPSESLGSIARTYYREASARRLALLRAYNELSSNTLRVGTVLRIPLDADAFEHGEVTERAKLEFGTAAPPPPRAAAPSKRRPGKRAAAPTVDRAQARRHVDLAERLYSTGRYAQCLEYAKQVLETKDEALPRPPKVELLRLAAASLVALERIAEAEATFAQLRRIDPAYELDLYRTSPKILDVFDAARR